MKKKYKIRLNDDISRQNYFGFPNDEMLRQPTNTERIPSNLNDYFNLNSLQGGPIMNDNIKYGYKYDSFKVTIPSILVSQKQEDFSNF